MYRNKRVKMSKLFTFRTFSPAGYITERNLHKVHKNDNRRHKLLHLLINSVTIIINSQQICIILFPQVKLFGQVH